MNGLSVHDANVTPTNESDWCLRCRMGENLKVLFTKWHDSNTENNHIFFGVTHWLPAEIFTSRYSVCLSLASPKLAFIFFFVNHWNFLESLIHIYVFSGWLLIFFKKTFVLTFLYFPSFLILKHFTPRHQDLLVSFLN